MKENNIIYFVEKGGDMTVTHRGVVGRVNEQYKMSPEKSESFIKKYESNLQLSDEQLKSWNEKNVLELMKYSISKKLNPLNITEKRIWMIGLSLITLIK